MKKILAITVAGLFLALHGCSTTCGPAPGSKGTPISYPVSKTEQNTPRTAHR